MSKIKYLLIAALMTGFSARAMAQDVKSQVSVIAKAIAANKNNPDAIKDQVKDFTKTFKKNAEAFVGLGRAYLDVKDTLNAQKYADQAIKINKSYAPGYVLEGDIEQVKDDGGAASGWYERAIYADPKDPDGYIKYATVNSKVSPAASVAKLEALRQQRPDYPVDLISAGIYDRAGDFKNALTMYDKVDKSQMKEGNLVSYALDNFLNGDFQKSLDIAQYGNQKFPRNAPLNRLAFYDLTNLKKYPEALAYADKLFNQSDSAKISESDYLYYGYAHLGNNDNDKAISMFQKSLSVNTDNAADKSDALKNIATAYQQKGDFPNAIKNYKDYLASLKQITAYDLGNFASMYMAQADSLTGADQVTAYKNADGVYAEIGDKFPSVADYAEYNRAHIAYDLDPDSKQGLAKPHYEKLIEIINAKPTKADTDTARLVEANRYLGYYYMLNNDNATSKTYWQKVLDLDPANDTAKQAMDALK